MPERCLRGDALVDLPVHPGAHLQLRRLWERHCSHRLLWGEDAPRNLQGNLTLSMIDGNPADGHH